MKFLLVVILTTLASFAALVFAKDATLEDRATGKDVAEAVLRKISRSAILPDDHSFLIRLAYVESRFGTDNQTFRANYFGGIWQVDEKYYNKTLESSLTASHKEIQKHFNISWNTTTWRDLLKPLYSGLAAALYFQTKPSIPETLVLQSQYWKNHYREVGNTSKFIKDSEELRNQTKCRGKMDLCIVLDGSGSILPFNYTKAKDFTASVIESFTLDFTRIGMLVYSGIYDSKVIFEINNNCTVDDLATLARNAPHPQQSTRTDLGLLLGIQMFNRSNAINETGKGVPKIMMVLTDGNSDSRQRTEAAVAKVANDSIRTVSVGIGNGIDHSELLIIAQNDSQSIFSLSNFDGLQDFIQEITTVACETPQEPVVDKPQNDSLVQYEKRVYKIKLPAIGITIKIVVKTGKTVGYWSRTERVPTAAVHEGIINGDTFIPGAGARLRAEPEDPEEPSVYFTIQGIEQVNNYTITAEEGNKTGGGGSGGSGGSGASSNYSLVSYWFLFIACFCSMKYFV